MRPDSLLEAAVLEEIPVERRGTGPEAHAHRVRAAVRHQQVLLAVGVEVPDRDRRGPVADRDLATAREAALAVTEANAQPGPVAVALWDREVLMSVGVEVPDRDALRVVADPHVGRRVAQRGVAIPEPDAHALRQEERGSRVVATVLVEVAYRQGVGEVGKDADVDDRKRAIARSAQHRDTVRVATEQDRDVLLPVAV